MRRHIILAMLLATAACSRAAETASVAPETAAGSIGGGGEARGERLLARRASIAVTVDDVARGRERATAVAGALGGHVQHATSSSDGRADLVLRVPAARLDAALDSMAALGDERRRTVGADDVTEESVDLDARLANLRALRDRLRQHLERATTVADVIAVERELARVQSELDALEARRAALRSSVAMARLEVALERRVVLGPLGLVLAGALRLVGKLFVWR